MDSSRQHEPKLINDLTNEDYITFELSDEEVNSIKGGQSQVQNDSYFHFTDRDVITLDTDFDFRKFFIIKIECYRCKDPIEFPVLDNPSLPNELH